MKIALNSDGFYEWGGGIDFIKYILSILETKPEICIDILLPRNDIHSLIRECISFLGKRISIHISGFVSNIDRIYLIKSIPPPHS